MSSIESKYRLKKKNNCLCSACRASVQSVDVTNPSMEYAKVFFHYGISCYQPIRMAIVAKFDTVPEAAKSVKKLTICF